MARAKLAIVQAVKTIEQVKRWAEKSLAPTPDAGERGLVRTIVDGMDRWRSKHLAILQGGKTLEHTKRRLHWWNPLDRYSGASAPSGA